MAKKKVVKKDLVQKEPGMSVIEQITRQNAGEELEWGIPKKEEPAATKQDDDRQALLDRIAALEKSQTDLRAEAQFSAFKGQPQQRVQDVKIDPQLMTFNTDGLPDPVTDTAKYNQELQKRINTALEARHFVAVQQAQASHDRDALVDQLWTGFQEAYPKWSEHEMLVEAAASRVSNDLQARGIDVTGLMKTAPSMFYREVAGLLEKQYPDFAKDEEEEEGEDVATEDAGRTAGVFGGQPASQTAQTPGKTVGRSLTSYLAEWQEKAGVA